MVTSINRFNYFLKDERAVPPKKNNTSDSGFDLVIIEEWKRISNNTRIYETGVIVSPPNGYYFEVVPRSSMSKLGWTLSNNVGVIDQDYRGTIKVALTRIDPNADDLELPLRCVQLLPRQFHHMEPHKVDDMDDDTVRGQDGGINRH